MKKKYELTEETKTLANGTVLRRIRAVSDLTLAGVKIVRAGDLGGWIEREDNLSHCGKAWVCDNAWVCGEARVCDNAWVCGEALVFDNAMVCDNAWVCGEARVCGKALVCGEARVFDNAMVCDNALVCGEARVCGKALVCGEARVCDNAWVCDNALVCDNAMVCDNAWVKDYHDYAVFKNTWSSGRWFTYTSSNKMWAVGCFRGTGDELVEKAYKDSKLSGQCYEAIVRAQEAIDKANALCLPKEAAR